MPAAPLISSGISPVNDGGAADISFSALPQVGVPALPDSNLTSDTTGADSTATDSSAANNDVLDAEVEYKAADSMLINIPKQIVTLYGDAYVKYETTELKADYIELSLSNKEIFATGVPDSNGVLQGRPEFNDAGQKFTADTMSYNFDTKKGKIKSAITQDGDGYVHGKDIKRIDDDVIFIQDGAYTTCSHPDPHFEIHSRKLKFIKNNKIVTGPAYLIVEDVPTPLAIPFGFFPNQKGQSSGIVIPSYGNSPASGYYLRDGGYYLGLSEYLDLRLTGDIFSRGSWSTYLQSNYKKRYKYNGAMKLSYSKVLTGLPEFPNRTSSENFFINWRHNQDPKARPNSSFSANVNAGTPQNFQNNFTSSTANFLTNTFQSAITYNKRFAGTPFNLTLSARHSQSSIDSIINVTLPQATFTMNRIYPFKRKKQVGSKGWYESIGVTWQTDVQNQVSEKQNDFLRVETLDLLRNGMRHTFPLNFSVPVFKHFTFSPSITNRWVMYTSTIEKRYDDSLGVVTDTIPGFSQFLENGASAALTTRLYNTQYVNYGPLKAYRHVMTPSVSVNYKPDYAEGNFSSLGYYKTLEYITTPDTNNPDSTVENSLTYSIFENGIYGSPSRNEAGVIGFSLQNTLEAKFKSDKDSTGLKKVKLLEAFNLSSSYNISATEFRWAPISATARTRLGKNISLQLNGTFDPYAIDTSGTRIHEAAWDVNDTPLRFTNGRAAVNFRLKGKSNRTDKDVSDRVSQLVSEQELAFIHTYPDAFVDFNVPWSLNFGYNLSYSKPGLESTLTNNFNFSGDVNVTPKWKVGFRSGYDFESNDFTYTTIDIYRDLHCWDFSLSLVPFGSRQSYSFDIKVKAAILQDLKLSRRRFWTDLAN